jgi:hypothetical protein
MTIQVGDTLPATNLTTMTAEGPKPVSMTELSAGKNWFYSLSLEHSLQHAAFNTYRVLSKKIKSSKLKVLIS